MTLAIGDILAPALGVALTPFPIVAVILMLASGRARTKGIAFAAGWVSGLAALVGALILIVEQFDIEANDSGPSTAASITRIVLGISLVGLAARGWTSRPGPDEDPPTPDWMTSLGNAAPLRAFGYGAMLAGLNPKNLLFNIVAGTAIASAGASATGEVVAWILYILLASLAVLIPVIWFLIAPKAASEKLERPRLWLIRNSSVMVAMIVLAIGVSQIGEGFPGSAERERRAIARVT